MANMFNEDGTYNKTEWKAGDRITVNKLNKIEESLEAINNNDISRHIEADARLDALEEDREDYATKNYVSAEIAKAQLEGEEIDLSGFATKDEIPTRVSELTNDKNFLSSIPSEYVTETELKGKGYLTSIPSEYITETELNNKGYLTSIPSEYVTDSELNDKGYLTEHQSLDNYATKSYVGEEIAKAQLEGEDVDLSSYATKAEIPTKVSDLENDKGYLTEHQSLVNYATKAEIPTNISQLTNDSGYLTSIPSEYVTDSELNDKGYLTSIPSEYVTDSELNDKGYLTEHQSLTNYATKSYVDEAINALRTELMDLINSGGGNTNDGPIDLSELFPISNTYLYPDGRAYEDAKGRGMLNVPLRNYTDFYITATALYSATIMVIYDVTGKLLGYKGNNSTEGVTWVEEHFVVSDLLEEYPNAYYISFSSYSRDAATTTLVVTAIPV